MKHKLQVLLTAVACICLLLPLPAMPAAQDAPGAATGKKIGNAISAAIEVAFPPVSKIIQAIWGNSGGDKKKAADAEPKLVAAQKEAAVQLSKLSSDLDTVSTF